MGKNIFGSNANEVGKVQASLEVFADGCQWMLFTSNCVVITLSSLLNIRLIEIQRTKILKLEMNVPNYDTGFGSSLKGGGRNEYYFWERQLQINFIWRMFYHLDVDSTWQREFFMLCC